MLIYNLHILYSHKFLRVKSKYTHLRSILFSSLVAVVVAATIVSVASVRVC